MIYLDDRMADRLGTMRQPGEGYSEVIIRLAGLARRLTGPPTWPEKSANWHEKAGSIA